MMPADPSVALSGADVGRTQAFTSTSVPWRASVLTDSALIMMQTFCSQVWNIVTLTKWLHQCPTEATWREHETVRNLRALAASLISHAQDRQPREDTFSSLPEYIDVLSAAHSFCERVKASPNAQDPFEVQCALIVGLQVYLPPLRGKPFWSLDLEDNHQRNSMSLLYHSEQRRRRAAGTTIHKFGGRARNEVLYRCESSEYPVTSFVMTWIICCKWCNLSLLADFITATPKDIVVCIRDQKTTKKTGNRKYHVPQCLHGLFQDWLQNKRPGMYPHRSPMMQHKMVTGTSK